MTGLRALTFVNHGRWIAHCPMPGCPNAEHFGKDLSTGHVGGLTGARFRCAHCAWVGPAEWPPNVDDIDRLLRQRPVPATRNWMPGETVHDLLAENIEHGILPATPDQIAAGNGGLLLAIVGDHLVSGAALAAGGRTPIGGA